MSNMSATRTTCRVEVLTTNSYYVWRNDTEFGPYNIRDIRQFWSAQILTPADFIRESHCGDWVDAPSFMLPLLTSDECHVAAVVATPVEEVVVAVADRPIAGRDGELGWGLMSTLVGLGGLTVAYFVGAHFLVTATLWLVCLALGIIGWWLYHSRCQLVLSLLFLAAIGLGVWPASATSQTPPAYQTAVATPPAPVSPGPGTLLGDSTAERTQTWTPSTSQLPGITEPVPPKVEATAAADLPPMPDLPSTALTGINR